MKETFHEFALIERCLSGPYAQQVNQGVAGKVYYMAKYPTNFPATLASEAKEVCVCVCVQWRCYAAG